MKADALYNLGPTSHLAPGQGKIDLVMRWFLSPPFFTSLPDVQGRVSPVVSLVNACGVRLAGMHYRGCQFRLPAHVNELALTYADSPAFLALPKRHAPVSGDRLPHAISACAVRGRLIDQRYHASGRDLCVAHHAPAQNGLDPVRPFAAPSMALYFRPLRLSWRDVWSPKRYLHVFLRELVGARAYRELFGRRARSPVAPGSTSVQWREALRQTRLLQEIRDGAAGLPDPWNSIDPRASMQSLLGRYWLASILRELDRDNSGGPRPADGLKC